MEEEYLVEGRKKWLIVLLVLFLVSGGGYFAYVRFWAPAETSATPVVQTSVVQEGDIVLTALGSGNLLPLDEVGVGSQSSGTVKEILVEVGDWVEKGDVLVRLDDTDAQLDVAQAEINLRLAELDLSELEQTADSAEMASAQASLYSTQVSLNTLLQGLTPEELEMARIDLETAKQSLDQARNNLYQAQIERDGKLGDVGVKDYQEKAAEASVLTAEVNVGKAEGSYEQARLNYEQVVAGATDEEIASARAKVAQAQASLDALDVDPITLEKAELDVEQARADLESAQTTLENTTLVAPIAGTVLSLDAEVGESVGENSFIILGDLKSPVIRFWVEEQDLPSIAEGNPVNVVFEALPDYTYTGEIINVEPVLVTVDNTSAVQSWATIDMTVNPVDLLSGMTAEVEVVAGEARGVPLVPLQALREISEGQYAVFVVGAGDKLEMRPVEIGLQDFVNVEIVSGLEIGETVRVGEETSSETVVPQNNGEMRMPPMGMGGM